MSNNHCRSRPPNTHNQYGQAHIFPGNQHRASAYLGSHIIYISPGGREGEAGTALVSSTQARPPSEPRPMLPVCRLRKEKRPPWSSPSPSGYPPHRPPPQSSSPSSSSSGGPPCPSLSSASEHDLDARAQLHDAVDEEAVVVAHHVAPRLLKIVQATAPCARKGGGIGRERG
jgi:hypothetical protein